MTGTEALAAAIVLNEKTQADALVSDSASEIIDAINRSLRGIYQVAAEVNPSYMGKTSPVTEAAGVWTRPADCELVYMIQTEAGAQVFASDPREPIPDPDKPFVYKWGRAYRRPAGAAVPTGTLTFWYSRRPVELEALSEEIDLEDAFGSLIVYDLGIWLAEHDERNDEVQAALRPHLERHLALYLTSLNHEAANVVRNVGQTAAFDSPNLTDLKTLLLSGG